jgi:hypothetical protein
MSLKERYHVSCLHFGPGLTDDDSASFPEDKVHTLSSNEHINVENDGKVTTQ